MQLAVAVVHIRPAAQAALVKEAQAAEVAEVLTKHHLQTEQQILAVVAVVVD
jgi:hypothetical protein